MKRPSHWHLKLKLFAGRRRALCFWCREELTFRNATVDHVIARVLGGKDQLENVVIACGPCNVKRSHWQQLLGWERELERIQANGSDGVYSGIKAVKRMKCLRRWLRRHASQMDYARADLVKSQLTNSVG